MGPIVPRNAGVSSEWHSHDYGDQATMKTFPKGQSIRVGRDITRAVRSGVDNDPVHGAVMPPLYLSANYSFAGLGEKREYDYSRTGNPSRDQFGNALAELEGGAGAVITGSGMSAVTLDCV